MKPERASWRRMRHGIAGAALVAVVVTATATGADRVAAVVATPSPAAVCSLDPVTLPLFDATPPAEIVARSSPAASPGAGEAMRPASKSEQVEIANALGVIVACLNTGNPAQVYGIFTDRYLAGIYADPTNAYLPAFEEELAGPTKPVQPPYVLVWTADIAFRDDGAAVVTATFGKGSESWTSTLVLVRDGDVWLIDGVVS